MCSIHFYFYSPTSVYNSLVYSHTGNIPVDKPFKYMIHGGLSTNQRVFSCQTSLRRSTVRSCSLWSRPATGPVLGVGDLTASPASAPCSKLSRWFLCNPTCVACNTREMLDRGLVPPPSPSSPRVCLLTLGGEGAITPVWLVLADQWSSLPAEGDGVRVGAFLLLVPSYRGGEDGVVPSCGSSILELTDHGETPSGGCLHHQVCLVNPQIKP